jgi:predicted  nucleic acid-binding Zn-ribbon protein
MKAEKLSQERLLALQDLDSSLMQLQHKASNLPLSKLLEEKRLEFASARDLAVAASAERSDIKHELSKSELDVEQVLSRIEKDEKRLSSGVGTPKELEQTQHELESLNKRRAELEDIELEVMVRLEGLDSRIAELSKRRDELAIEVEAITKDRDQALEQISQAISATKSDRGELVKEIEAELLSLYEKIRSTSDGLAAVRLADGKCQGCHLTMSAAELTRINSIARDELVRCEECRRILIRIT